MDAGGFVLFFILLGALYLAVGAYARKRRRQALMAKYQDAAIVDRIMKRNVWQGMSTEQLLDLWGKPADCDQKVYKTKTKEVWKYGRTGKNRFSQRVFVEDCLVVGWENK